MLVLSSEGEEDARQKPKTVLMEVLNADLTAYISTLSLDQRQDLLPQSQNSAL